MKPLLALFRDVRVKALSHITGGGLLENLPRVLPEGCSAVLDAGSWSWPAVFSWLQEQGNVETSEMHRTFNCGVGMVVCVAEEDAEAALASLSAAGETAWRLGRIEQDAAAPVVLAGG